MIALKFCFVIWMLFFFVSCGNSNESSLKGYEVDAQVAPDQRSKAFIWLPELGGLGATISEPHQVWMQGLQGEKQKSLIFEADKTDGVRLRWTAATELEICYAQAQIFHFRNFFVMVEIFSPQIYQVEIILRKAPKLDDC